MTIHGIEYNHHLDSLDELREPLIKPESGPTSSGDSKVTRLFQKTVDQRGETIWTHTDFKWALRNPLAVVLKRGNDYVTEQWSEDYFTSCKKDVGLAKDSIKNVGRSLWQCHFSDAGKHFLNALLVVLKLGVNIEIANFLKGILGVLISSGKLVFHTIVFAMCFALTILTLPALLCDPNITKLFFKEMLANLGFVAKDIASIISCVGHTIPSWLPLLIFVVCPPAGIALAIVKAGSKFMGVFDVLAYGGTAALLYAKAKIAQWDLRTNSGDVAAKKAIGAWDNLKKELNPFKSLEGATLAMYAVHVLVEGVATVVDAFVPGAGTIVKYTAWGVQGVAATALASAVYKNSRESTDSARESTGSAGEGVGLDVSQQEESA